MSDTKPHIFQKGSTSLINWLSGLEGTADTIEDSYRYDLDKTSRLEFLHDAIGLPINTTHYINGEDFDINAEKIKSIIKERGGDNVKCAFRIAPKEDYLNEFEVIKKYALTFRDLHDVLSDLGINMEHALIRVTNYRDKLLYSCVLNVGKEGIVGEIVNGNLYKLTYTEPLEDGQMIHQFFQKDGELSVLPENEQIKNKVEEIISNLKVSDDKQKIIFEKGYEISEGYVVGYYEYVEGLEDAAFTDMNNKKISTNMDLGGTLNFLHKYERSDSLQGLVACASDREVLGTVQIINNPESLEFTEGNILVCDSTTADYLPIMKKAKAIVTERGGIMSHAAIIARELRIPTIVGVKGIMNSLKDGDIITLDFSSGKIVKK